MGRRPFGDGPSPLRLLVIRAPCHFPRVGVEVELCIFLVSKARVSIKHRALNACATLVHLWPPPPLSAAFLGGTRPLPGNIDSAASTSAAPAADPEDPPPLGSGGRVALVRQASGGVVEGPQPVSQIALEADAAGIVGCALTSLCQCGIMVCPSITYADQ